MAKKKKKTAKKAVRKITRKGKKKVAGGVKKSRRRPAGSKKPAKKRAKRKAVTLSNISLTQQDLRMIELDRKRMVVKSLLPEIECTGQEECGGEMIPYTEAAIVREEYYAAFDSAGLTVCPHAAPGMMPQMQFQGRMFAVSGAYRITDRETGFSVYSWGVGIGVNADWAANTAQTRAMKQFLLGSFETNWKDPNRNQAKELIKKEMKDFNATDFVGVHADPDKIAADINKQAQQVWP